MLDTTTHTQALLGDLVMALASGRIRVVDLTQTLTPEFPQIALPPEMGQCWPFRIEEVSRYDERGPAGTGTIFPAASTPARTSTRRSTGSRAATCRTTRSTRFRCSTSSRRPA